MPSAVMYGTPSASFKVKVTVTDDAQLPIKGLKVQKNIHNYDSLTFGITDAKGQTTLEWRDNGVIDTLRLIVKDIDGPANGTFKNDSVKRKIERKEYKGGDGNWYVGHFETEIDAQMEKDGQ